MSVLLSPVSDISFWMYHCQLKLNIVKTKFFIFPPKPSFLQLHLHVTQAQIFYDSSSSLASGQYTKHVASSSSTFLRSILFLPSPQSSLSFRTSWHSISATKLSSFFDLSSIHIAPSVHTKSPSSFNPSTGSPLVIGWAEAICTSYWHLQLALCNSIHLYSSNLVELCVAQSLPMFPTLANNLLHPVRGR